MRTSSRILLLTAAASLSLTVPGFAQEAEKEAPKKPTPPARPEAPAAPAPKAEEKPGRPDMEKMREQMQGRMQEIQKLREAGKNEEAEKLMAEFRKKAEEMRTKFGEHGPGPGRGGPDMSKLPEPMRDKMQEIHKLHEAGKHEQAEEMMADMRKHMGEMREQMAQQGHDRDQGRGQGGPDRKDGAEPPRGPQRPAMEGGHPDRKPEAPKAEQKPRPQPEVAERSREGHDRPDMEKMREHMQGRMQEIHKLREAGKNEEAEKMMAEFKKEAGEIREKMAQHGQRGPGGPPRGPDAQAQRGPQRPPQADGARHEKGPEPPRFGFQPGRPGPGGDHDRPDMAKMREHMQARVQEIRNLHQSGKHEEANREMAEFRKHIGEMRARFGRPQDHHRRGQNARAQGRPDHHAGKKRHDGHRGHAKKGSRDFQPRAGARPAGPPRQSFGRGQGQRGPGGFQGRGPQGPFQGGRPPAPMMGRGGFGPGPWQAWGGGRPGFQRGR